VLGISEFIKTKFLKLKKKKASPKKKDEAKNF